MISIESNFKIDIKPYRRAMRISKYKLSTLVGMSKSSITELEQGKRIPSALTLYKLSLALNCKMEDLIKIA